MTVRFSKDFASLTPEQQEAFRVAVRKMVEDLRGGSAAFRKGLRIKGVKGAAGVYEMTWSGDGRATFEFGAEQVVEGEAHIVWRRIGTHEIFGKP